MSKRANGETDGLVFLRDNFISILLNVEGGLEHEGGRWDEYVSSTCDSFPEAQDVQ